ncbi:MAG: hypothetical protein ABIO72_00345 [Patescibacteria group bacterium]
MPKQESTTDLKVLAAFGGAACIAIIGFMVWTVVFFLPDERKAKCYDVNRVQVRCEDFRGSGSIIQQAVNGYSLEDAPARPEPVKPSGLGSEGSVCGGPNRLPCMPGLSCAVSQGESMGICAKVAPMDNNPAVK